MQVKLLKDVVASIAGAGSERIVDFLHNKKNVNEFLIAKKLDVNVNQARNILYKLSEKGLVSFIRKKDKKNGGWYTYFWTLDVGKSLFNLKESLVNEIKSLEEQIKSRETKRFYYSPSADIEYSEEKALEYEFICPETGEVMELKDNSAEIAEMNKMLGNLRKDLEIVEGEIDNVSKKDEAVRRRKVKAEEKKKAVEREAKRKARAKEREKESAKKGGAKKTGKKTIKKTEKKSGKSKVSKKNVKSDKKKTVVKKTVSSKLKKKAGVKKTDSKKRRKA